VTVAPVAPRLIDRDVVGVLDRAAARKVTIISAPAGSGKTCLLRSWAHGPGRSRRIAFVHLRRDQHDTQQFWLSLLDAIRHACGAERPAVTPDFNASTMVDRVLAELADAPDGVTLIIDDLHELNSPEALAHLTRLLTSLPPRVHAILATRHDVRLRLHQLRLAGDLAELRAPDLRFSEPETRELLEASGIALSTAGATLLHQRTEGWAAGLRLAVLSLSGHPDPERFVTEFSGSDRTIAEYLIAEMLDRQPADVQDLLLRTALLDRVNGELADLLTGRSGSERILLALEDANAFVVSLDPERTWFRYHHLFADLLRLELRRTLPTEVPALHRRAARWFSRQGQVIDAVRHMQAAGDWPDAARMLADHAFSMTLDGQTQTMHALTRAFPTGSDQPELALVRATVDLAQGRLDEADAHLTVAETYAEAAPPERRRRLQVAVAALKLSLTRRSGQFIGVLEHIELLDSPDAGHAVEDIALGSDLRAMALLNLGTAEVWSRMPDAERHLREGAALAREIDRPYVEVACLAQVAFASLVLHSFATTRQRCHEAIALAERHGWGVEPVIVPALIALASTMVWTGEFDECEGLLRRTARALQTDTGPDIRLVMHMTSGLLHAGRGRHHDALNEFGAAEQLASRLRGSQTTAALVTSWLLAARARAGHPGEARAALEELDDERSGAGEIGNARAVICLAEGDPSAALAAVGDVLDGTAPVIGYHTGKARGPSVAEAHLLAAHAHRALGDQRAANQAVERALALAELDGLVLPFAMANSAELLEALPRHQTAHAALLADILDVLHSSSPTATGQSSSQAEELSPSELKVLRYLPTNLSRPEIASELSVSLNTVSTHLRRIYAKLQVQDRSSAVQRARELRLLAARQTR
jgi:LuxR family maltose regulon positive regulatory protein